LKRVPLEYLALLLSWLCSTSKSFRLEYGRHFIKSLSRKAKHLGVIVPLVMFNARNLGYAPLDATAGIGKQRLCAMRVNKTVLTQHLDIPAAITAILWPLVLV
jgi:hypothetical protein